MATIHIREIQRILAERGEKDALPDSRKGHGYFVEIRFDDPAMPRGEVDEELRDRVITADCPYGSVVIQFDERGYLKSLDLS